MEPKYFSAANSQIEVLQTDSCKVSVIIPVYNEERCVLDSINSIKSVLLSMKCNYEIIVVNDGSTDGTGKLLKNFESIRYFEHSNNIGYGAALKTGLKKARGEHIVITDADNTYPCEMIPNLVEHLNEYDMVVGSRAMNSKNIPISRKPMKWIIGKLSNYLSQTKIPDLNSGLRAFKRDVAMKFIQLYPKGFSFTTTITLAMHCNSFDVKYIPITYGKRVGKSKIRPIKDTINFFQLIYRTVMYFNPIKIFMPVALLVLLVAFISLGYDILVLDNLTDKTVISFGTFIQVFLIGLIADLISKRIIPK